MAVSQNMKTIQIFFSIPVNISFHTLRTPCAAIDVHTAGIDSEFHKPFYGIWILNNLCIDIQGTVETLR